MRVVGMGYQRGLIAAGHVGAPRQGANVRWFGAGTAAHGWLKALADWNMERMMVTRDTSQRSSG